MAVTITEQLTKLNQLRQQLAANLTTKGVTATATEKFNTLVPKVLAISGGESNVINLKWLLNGKQNVWKHQNGEEKSDSDGREKDV